LSPDNFFIILIVPWFDGIVNGEKVLLFACHTLRKSNSNCVNVVLPYSSTACG